MNRTFLTAVAMILGQITTTGISPSLADELHYQGYVEAEYTWIALPGSGQLKKLSVKRGGSVEKYDHLFSLDDRRESAIYNAADLSYQAALAHVDDLKKGARPSELNELEAKVEELKALIAFYKVDHDREQKLLKTGASSKERFDIAKAQLEAARARLKGAESKLVTANLGGRADALIVAEKQAEAALMKRNGASWELEQRKASAPAQAYVFDTYYNEGEFVEKGKPVVSLLEDDKIRVRFFVPETHVSTIEIGGDISISCDSCPPNISASISYISPKAEYTPPVIYSEEVRSKLVFMIEAQIKTSGIILKPGLPVDVVVK